MCDDPSFERFVQTCELDAETLYQAARSYLAERLDHPAPAEVMAELANVVDDADRLVARLEDDGPLLEDAALCVLDAAWREPAERLRIRRAVTTAKDRLPVVDPSVIVPLVLYGLHELLRRTSRKERTVVRGRDGKTRTTTLEESGALAVVLGAIHRWRENRQP